MPRRSKDPVRLVSIVGVVGAAILGIAYFFVDSVAHQVVAKTEPTKIETAQIQLLSARRTPNTLSTVVRTGSVRRSLANVASQLPSGSCLTVEWMGQKLLDVRGSDSFIPASAQKLVTAAAALKILGPTHTYETAIHATGNAASGTVQDLYFVGGGDPLIVRNEYIATEKYPTIHPTSLEKLADAIVAAGVRVVSGSIVGVESRYDQIRFLDAWPSSFNVVEAGPLGALLVNDGAVVGQGMKPDNPAIAAAIELRSLLGARGVSVIGEPRTEPSVPASAERVTGISSAPLRLVLNEMLVNSDNNTSELVVKEIGVASAKTGSTAAGLAAINSFLQSNKLPTAVTVADGSGLSSNNRVSCDNFMSLLTLNEGEFPTLLPVAGETGTLRSAFEDSSVKGRLVAKTGTLTGVKSLVGYLPLEGNSPVKFALVMNSSGIDNQNQYRPIWNALGSALNKAQPSPTATQLAP